MSGRKKVENKIVGDIQINKGDNADKPTIKKIGELARDHSRRMGKAYNVQERKIQINHADCVKTKYIRSMDFHDNKGKVVKQKEYCVGVGKILHKQEKIIADRGMSK